MNTKEQLAVMAGMLPEDVILSNMMDYLKDYNLYKKEEDKVGILSCCQMLMIKQVIEKEGLTKTLSDLNNLSKMEKFFDPAKN